MSMIAALTLAVAAQGAGQGAIVVIAPPETEFDVGYAELMAGHDQEAVDAIEKCRELAKDDPARLLNHGIALARLGRYDHAREDFEAAASFENRIELETSTGKWEDSRVLAHRALAMLDDGEFARYYALSMR